LNGSVARCSVNYIGFLTTVALSTLIAERSRPKPEHSFVDRPRQPFLAVSGQLNVEAYSLALTKVYTFGPTFRAENSNTSCHLAEFWMIEPEIAFADLSDNVALAEALLKYTFAALLNERQEDLAFFDQRIEKGLVAKLEGIVGSEFVHMDYGEAIEVLERANEKFEFPVKWGIDPQSEHERYLTEKYAKKPVVVMNYPKAIKASCIRLNDDGRTVEAMDVLAPGIGEIIGGSQREERLEVLAAIWPGAASTGSTTPGPAICAATARHGAACRLRPRPGFRRGHPSPTSPASPTSATPSPSREPRRRAVLRQPGPVTNALLSPALSGPANSLFSSYAEVSRWFLDGRATISSVPLEQTGAAKFSRFRAHRFPAQYSFPGRPTPKPR
jgi:hypothetical protein